MSSRHDQLVRDRYLRDLHETMLKHKITVGELVDYAENRYVNRAKRMEEIRTQQQHARKMRDSLAKAREAKKSKGGV